MQRDAGADFYRVIGFDPVVDLRPLQDAIDPHVDRVALAASLNGDTSVLAVDHEGRGPDALQGVAQLSARRADVVGLVGDADGIVEGPL